MIGQSVRRIGFWTLDALKGGPVRKRLKYLEKIYNSKTTNMVALKDLLVHAIDTVPYYSNVTAPDIHCFPVVSKENYKQEFDSFRSSRYLNNEKLHKVYTSGSTGTPFMAYQDDEKLLWHRAGLIAINSRIGWNLGDRFMFFRLWGVSHSESKISQVLSNMIPVDVMNLNEEKLESVRQRLLEDKNQYHLLGYASALEKLSKFLIEKNDKVEEYGIRLVIADSENLSLHAKGLIEKAFGCPVLNRYGNNENGIIGLTPIGETWFEINFPEYYVEILKIDKDEPAPLGTLGRIVITDLYNKAFPFIRYDTGDIGIARKMKDDQCFELQELCGRVSTMLMDTRGNSLGETAITAFFENINGIGRFQIAQINKGIYELRLENTSVSLDEQLIKLGQEAFGNDAIIQVAHVDRIPQGKNGKYKITSYEVKE